MVNGLVTSLLVIKQLLLRSGNVEENPGPLGQHARDLLLDSQCTVDHMLKVAARCTFDWKVVCRRLLEDYQACEDIDCEERSEQSKRDRMFQKWKEMKGSHATYRELITVFESIGNRAAAEMVNELALSVVKDAATPANEVASMEGVVPQGKTLQNEDDTGASLMDAARSGDLQKLKQLINSNANINVQDVNGSTPLHLAAQNGESDCVEALLSCTGIDRNIKDNDDNMALHEAAIHSRLACLTVFKVHGCDLCSLGKDNNSVLHFGAKNGWLNGIRYILEGGYVSVKAVNRFNHTALHEAAKYGHADCAGYLIEKGADVNIRSVSGRTPLHRAVVSGHIEVVKLLLNVPTVDVNCPNIVGSTPLITAVMNGWVNIVQLILEKSPDQCTSNQLGNTALHYAVSCGHYDVMNCLLSKSSIDLNIINKERKTPMDLARDKNDTKMLTILSNYEKKAVKTVHHSSAECTEAGVSVDETERESIHQCAIKGYAQQLKQLIKLNPDTVNQKDVDGKTPLHHASYYGFITCVSLLMDVPNIDANCQDKNGSTPLHLAARSGIAVCVQKLLLHKKIKEEMKPDNDGNFAYHVAAMHCRLACLKVFKSIFINEKGKDDNTILHYAAEIGWLDGIRYILNEGNAKSIVDCQNKMGDTALHLAAARGHESVVKELLRRTKNVNLVNNCTYTPLIVAAIYGSLQIVQDLLAKEAIATAVTNLGNTALQYAAVGGHCAVVACLLSHIEPNTQNKLGFTALHYAAAHGYLDVVQCLLSKTSINLAIINIDGKTAMALAEEGKHAEVVELLKTYM